MKSFKDELFDSFELAEAMNGVDRTPNNFEKVETFTDRFGQTYEAGVINNTAFKLNDEFQKKPTSQSADFDFTEPSKDFQAGDDALLDYHRNTITSDNVLFEKDDKGNMSPTTVFIRGIKNPDDPNSPIYSVPGYVDGKKDYTERELQDIAKEKGWFSIYPSDPDSATHMARVNRVKNVINADGEKLLNSQRTGVDKTVDVIKDTGQAIATGGEKGIKQMNQSLFSILGSPVDFANFVVKSLTGDKDFKGPIPNTKDIQQGFQKLSDWTDKYVPVVTTENIDREYTNKTYSSIIEGISEFASGAIPAAKVVGATKKMKRGLEVTGNLLKGNLRIGLGKALPGLVAPSGIVRGATWGAIADAITINPEKGLQNEIASLFKEIKPEKRNIYVKTTIGLLEYDDSNAELVERLRGTLGGLIIGAAVDFGVIPLAKGIYKAAKDAPWEELD
jgi:hypothetical protein